MEEFVRNDNIHFIVLIRQHVPAAYNANDSGLNCLTINLKSLTHEWTLSQSKLLTTTGSTRVQPIIRTSRLTACQSCIRASATVNEVCLILNLISNNQKYNESIVIDTKRAVSSRVWHWFFICVWIWFILKNKQMK